MDQVRHFCVQRDGHRGLSRSLSGLFGVLVLKPAVCGLTAVFADYAAYLWSKSDISSFAGSCPLAFGSTHAAAAGYVFIYRRADMRGCQLPFGSVVVFGNFYLLNTVAKGSILTSRQLKSYLIPLG